ncbi:MAG: hypothetical protein ACLFUE_03070, partial [Desulfobacteraceae bacterium]
IEAGGGRMVRSSAELEQAVSGLLDDGVAAREMGRRAGGFVRSNQGAVDRVLDEIEGLLDP